MGNSKKLLWIVIAVLILLNLSTFISQRTTNNNLLNTMDNLNSQIAHLNQQLSNQTNNINQSLSKFREEQKLVRDGNFKLLDFDADTGKIKTKISWTFRELALNSDVYLLYGEREPQFQAVENWTQVEAADSHNLNYDAEVYLSPDKEYSFKVQWENNMSSKADELMNIPLNQIIRNRISLMPAMDTMRSPRYEHHVYILNNFNGAQFLKIKSAKADIYVKGKLENTVTLYSAADEDIETDELKKKYDDSNTELWLNDKAIWVKGEENWVKTGENRWTNKGVESMSDRFDIRIEVTIIDNMGVTYKKTYGSEY